MRELGESLKRHNDLGACGTGTRLQNRSSQGAVLTTVLKSSQRRRYQMWKRLPHILDATTAGHAVFDIEPQRR